jgi:hypothetical protein
MRIKISDDRVKSPVPVFVDNVAPVAVGQQFRVKPLVCRPRLRVWADANFEVALGGFIWHPTNLGATHLPEQNT